MSATATRIVVVVCAVLVALSFYSPDLFRSPQRQLKPAILEGDIRKVEHLLGSRSVDVNLRPDGAGATALSAAAAHGQLEIAKMLLQHGADPNLGNSYDETPLRSAAYHGDLEMCRLLIEAGADVNKADNKYGWTPLRTASYKGHAEVVRLLKSHGAHE